MKRTVLCILMIFGLITPLFAQSFFMNYNGSRVEIFEEEFEGQMRMFILYRTPRTDLSALGIRPASFMFTGTIIGEGENQKIIGAAYFYKQGCPPIPYLVEGGWHQSAGNRYLLLEGREPSLIDEECRVIDYDWGANSTITITH